VVELYKKLVNKMVKEVGQQSITKMNGQYLKKGGAML
jgi:hypothetical protein